MSFIPYQIDYSVHNTAKTIGFSKKRVIFKFGFANMSAIRENKVGVDCRGSEHEIIFIWSLLNGKRQLICNHKDIHYSESKQNGWTTDHTWQHVFVLHDHHTNQKYRIHFMSQKVGGSSNTNSDSYADEYNMSNAAAQQNNQHPFDLRIGNLSYFQFNPIYQLGTPRMIVGQLGSSNNHNQRSYQRMDSPMLPEERQQLAAAKLASLQDIAAKEEAERQKRAAASTTSSGTANVAPPPPPPTTTTTNDLLISFDDDNLNTTGSNNQLATTGTGSTLPSNVPTTIQATTATTATTGSNIYSINNNSNSNQYFGASSITMDQFDMSQDLTLSNRQQPGSFYNYNNNNNNNVTSSTTAPMTNPYASTSATINPYAATTATTTINPYIPSNSNMSTSSSTALTPYQAPTTTTSGSSNYYNNYQTAPSSSSSSSYAIPSAHQSYVDATGRLNIGIPPLAPTAPPTAPPPINTYSNNNPTSTNYYNTNPYNNTNNYDASTTTNTNATNPLSSPSGTTSVWTYGSEAPSFAQPPPQPPPQQYTTTSTINNPSYYGGSNTMPYNTPTVSGETPPQPPQQQIYGQQSQPQTYPYNY